MNTFELELLAVNQNEMAQLERAVAAFVRREHRLPGYDDLVRHRQPPEPDCPGASTPVSRVARSPTSGARRRGAAGKGRRGSPGRGLVSGAAIDHLGNRSRGTWPTGACLLRHHRSPESRGKHRYPPRDGGDTGRSDQRAPSQLLADDHSEEGDEQAGEQYPHCATRRR